MRLALATPFPESTTAAKSTRSNNTHHEDQLFDSIQIIIPSSSNLDFPFMLLNNIFSFLCSSLNQDVVVLDVVVDVVVTAVVDVDVAVEARRTRRPGRLFFISCTRPTTPGTKETQANE